MKNFWTWDLYETKCPCHGFSSEYQKVFESFTRKLNPRVVTLSEIKILWQLTDFPLTMCENWSDESLRTIRTNMRIFLKFIKDRPQLRRDLLSKKNILTCTFPQEIVQQIIQKMNKNLRPVYKPAPLSRLDSPRPHFQLVDSSRDPDWKYQTKMKNKK